MLDYQSGIKFDCNLLWMILGMHLIKSDKHILDIMNKGILINKVTMWLVFVSEIDHTSYHCHG